MRVISLFGLFALCLFSAVAQEPVAQTHAPFSYPRILRMANYSGDAVVKFVIGVDGRVSAAEGVSGIPMALLPAIEQVKTWQFAPSAAGAHQVRFHFHLEQRAEEDDSNAVANETVFVTGLVDVMSTARDTLVRDGCPIGTERLPPQNRSAADWVETSWPRLRVLSNGVVLWDPPGDWSSQDWTKATTAKIDPELARHLMEQFRTAAFWRLCKSYDNGATDTSTDSLRVSLGGVEREVNVHDQPAPPAFTALLNAIHETTNSHQWRVGDPAKEQMGDMGADVWLPKPGRTTMMAEAHHGKRSAVEADLLAGEDVNGQDASGWTPLMYAAGGYSGEEGSVTQLLIAKGADVKAHGLHGETALHFAALCGEADEDLLTAGANVNAVTADGITPLMLLVQRGDAKEIRTLLAAGAEAVAKDAHGRTAMDYLEAANCNRAIVMSDTHPWMTHTGGSCRELDADEMKQSAALLLHAGAVAAQHWTALTLADVASEQ